MSDAIDAGSLELRLEADSSKLLAELSAVADKAGKQIERTLQKQIDRLDSSKVEATFTSLSNQINRQFSDLGRVQINTFNQLNRSIGNTAGLRELRREVNSVTFSLRELKSAHQELRNQLHFGSSIKIDTSELRGAIAELKMLRQLTQSSFKISTSGSRSATSPSTPRPKSKPPSRRSGSLDDIKTGFFEGIGGVFATQFGTGMMRGVESTFDISLRKLGSNLGSRYSRVAKNVPNNLLKGLGFDQGFAPITAEFNQVLKKWENQAERSAFTIGKSISNGIRGDLGLVKTDLVSLTKELGSLTLETSATPLRIRKQVAATNALQSILKRQEGVQVDRNEAIRSARSITIATGGMNFSSGGKENTNFVGDLLKPILPNSYVVPVANPFTNNPEGFPTEFDQFAKKLVKNLGLSLEEMDLRVLV